MERRITATRSAKKVAAKKKRSKPAATRVAKAAAPPAPIGRPRGKGVSKDKILAIATRMFAELGYAALSIRDIAAASKINIPSIYHFFGGKENLYNSCCNAAFSAMAEKLHASLLSGADAQTRVKNFAICLSEILLENREFCRLLLQEIIMRDESRHYDELSMHYFVAEFRMLAKELAVMEGDNAAAEHAFSIYALTFGLILLRRTSEVAGVDQAHTLNSVRLAKRVLGIVLPHLDWDA